MEGGGGEVCRSVASEVGRYLHQFSEEGHFYFFIFIFYVF